MMAKYKDQITHENVGKYNSRFKQNLTIECPGQPGVGCTVSHHRTQTSLELTVRPG